MASLVQPYVQLTTCKDFITVYRAPYIFRYLSTLTFTPILFVCLIKKLSCEKNQIYSLSIYLIFFITYFFNKMNDQN
jgi:hypothetical protein